MADEEIEDTPTTKPAMYPQLKRSLETLIEEFRHLSLKYGPIRHELFRAFDEERTTEESWIAFAESGVDSGKLLDEWEEWTGPEDGSFYSRFSGDGGGMEDFTALAESAFLSLCEFDPTAKKSYGFHGWMLLLHDMAFKYPTTFLRSEMSVWGLGELPDTDGFEEYTSQWVEIEGQTPFPKHPLCWRLTHNVFISSIATLRILIEPEMALLVGKSLDDLPIPVRLPKTSTQDTVGETSTTKPMEPHTEGFWMAKKPGGYFLTFDYGDFHEEGLCGDIVKAGQIQQRNGFAYIFALFCQPGKAIPVDEMDRAAGLAYQPLRAISIGDIEMQIESHGSRMEMHGGPGLVENTFSDYATEESIQAVRDELKAIELIMKERPDERTYDEAEATKAFLEKELKRTARHPNSSDPQKQNIPRVVNESLKNITDKVRKAINEAIAIVRVTPLPNCADYLDMTVDYENQGWIYNPNKDPRFK
jgi:hypothetical protein